MAWETLHPLQFYQASYDKRKRMQGSNEKIKHGECFTRMSCAFEMQRARDTCEFSNPVERETAMDKQSGQRPGMNIWDLFLSLQKIE